MFVAGQSNAVGNSATADGVNAGNDAYDSLPIFYEQFGIDPAISQPGWDGTPANGVLRPPVGNKIPATGGGGRNDFVANFTKNYVSGPLFVPGRAMLVVNVAFGSSGVLQQYPSRFAYNFPAPGSTLILCWAPDAACNPAVATAVTANAAMLPGAVTMSLYTARLLLFV